MIEHFKNGLNNIDDLLNKLPENYCILEEKVDIETQMSYFNALEKVEKEDLKEKDIAMLIASINSDMALVDDIKENLVRLAGVEEVTAYRAIENYYNSLESGELKSWAAMAIQESRMLIQSQLMDEQQVFIASGLGGKGHRLRYFVVGDLKDQEKISDFWKESIVREFQFTLDNNDSVLESIEFKQQYVLMNVLVPLKIDLKNLFKPAVEECGNLGIPIQKNLLLTNVKEIDIDEIDRFINREIKDVDSIDE